MTDRQSSSEGRAIILVVERDPHVRELEAFFLNEAGYAVEFTEDGTSALERARQLRPELVITEVLVPKLDGLALCRELKNDPQTADIMVLIFSILAASTRAREAGADAFLMKPLAERRLVDTVRELIAKHGESVPVEGA
ncbi:MAG TPA: response regulator [Longimicrobiales bacterium]|nr:response regulator [Longimicrobiales bacterium]